MKWCDLSRQWIQIAEEVKENVNRVFEHQNFVGGLEVQEFEQQISSKIKAKAVACHSGTDALVLALKVMGVKKGDGILTTCFSFIATAEAICRVGAVPLFCDIDSKTFNLTMETLDIQYQLYQNGKGLIPFYGNIVGVLAVNLFGIPCDYAQINLWAKQRNLFVIEDAAQSMGATFQGKPSGSLADISTTSFYPTKPLGSYGQGGAVFCKSSEQENQVRSLTQHGLKDGVSFSLGLNSRMDTLQASILLVKWKYFVQEQAQRKKWVERYHQLLPISFLPYYPKEVESSFSFFSILVQDRKKLHEKLIRQGIPFQIHYSTLLSDHPIFTKMGYKREQFSNAHGICSKIISLPLYAYLKENEQNQIVKVFLESV